MTYEEFRRQLGKTSLTVSAGSLGRPIISED